MQHRLEDIPRSQREESQCGLPRCRLPSVRLNVCLGDDRLVPELFVLGAQKAATTTFYNFLNRTARSLFQVDPAIHQVLGSNLNKGRKEAHIFDAEQYDAATFPQYFPDDCDARPRAVSIDFTPNYLCDKFAAERVYTAYADLASRLTFIVILRDPLSRMRSAYYHGLADGWVKKAD